MRPGSANEATERLLRRANAVQRIEKGITAAMAGGSDIRLVNALRDLLLLVAEVSADLELVKSESRAAVLDEQPLRRPLDLS